MKPYLNDAPQEIPFEGNPIRCPICDHAKFWIMSGPWLFIPTDCYVCSHCGNILLFRPRGTY